MEKLILVIHVISAIALVLVVLLQKSEGGALSGLGGGGGGDGMLSARGTATALSRITAVLATVFMATALFMSSISNKSNVDEILEKVEQPLIEQTDGEVPLTE